MLSSFSLRIGASGDCRAGKKGTRSSRAHNSNSRQVITRIGKNTRQTCFREDGVSPLKRTQRCNRLDHEVCPRDLAALAEAWIKMDLTRLHGAGGAARRRRSDVNTP